MKILKTSILTLMIASCMQGGKPDERHGIVQSWDQTEIHYTVYGDCEAALVFVHGWCCDQGYWREQVDTLSKEFTVVTIDLAGHGRSGTGRQDYTLQAFGMDVAAVVEHLKLERIILIGHSMGGGVILAAARQLQEQTLALVGVDTYQGFKHEYSDSLISQFVQPFQQDFINTTIGFVKGMFPPDADSLLVKAIAEDMASNPPEVGISAIENNISTDPATLLAGLDVPIYSINSSMFPVDIEGNREIYPDFEVVLMEGIGHFVQLEDPATFNRLLHDIINPYSSCRHTTE
jgi:pimeloyl-ACP methyl ester carboxylesterase